MKSWTAYGQAWWRRDAHSWTGSDLFNFESGVLGRVSDVGAFNGDHKIKVPNVSGVNT